MENMLLRILPKRKFPVLLRYTAASIIVLISALLRYSMNERLEHYPLLLFFPAVFLCALLFDKGTGFFATAFAALIAASVFMAPRFSLAIARGDTLALVIFVIVGCTMAAVTEALRETVEELAISERSKSLLLEELAHRTKNDLAIIGSTITLQARAADNAEVRRALEAANNRVQVVAAAQTRLRGKKDVGEIELCEYLEAICGGLGDLLRGIRPIAVRVDCPGTRVSETAAVSVGLIVNELVTNSLKYAFPGDRGGIINVGVTLAGRGLQVRVQDNGIGCPDAPDGLGTRLVRLLAKQLGGKLTRESDANGCSATVNLDLA